MSLQATTVLCLVTLRHSVYITSGDHSVMSCNTKTLCVYHLRRPQCYVL